jgi:hypothetical protein
VVAGNPVLVPVRRYLILALGALFGRLTRREHGVEHRAVAASEVILGHSASETFAFFG